MNAFSHVPPGFRFHPTDEELVDYYLRKKIAARKIDLDVIKEVDLYKIEPWDLQELCRIGSEEQSDWYFFSHKDKKYPTGTRTNRATKAGFWKATGRDKAIYLKHCLIGMRKTLVFYKGRAPNGQKSDWIMHEYRLETNENGTPQEEGWVVCRVFKKRLPTARRLGDDSPWLFDDQTSFLPSDMESPRRMSHPYTSYPHLHHQGSHHYPCKQELEMPYNMNNNPHHQIDPIFLQLPQLESPKVPPAAQSSGGSIGCGATSMTAPPNYGFDGHHNGRQEHEMQQQQSYDHQQQHDHNINSYLISCNNMNNNNNAVTNQHVDDQVRDWRALDKFVASQLSQDEHEAPKETNYTSNNNDNSGAAATAAHEFGGLSSHQHDPGNMMIGNSSNRSEMLGNEYASTSTSSCCPIDLWK